LVELGLAARLGADAALLSPVFPTATHPGGEVLGPVRFQLLARQSKLPIIALGGMTKSRAHALAWRRWAAIDGLS
jgi:thiamine-phosphate pyrophosphorylase